MTTKLSVWGDEDGEQWFVQGRHLDVAGMAIEIEKLEEECNGQPYYDEEHRADVEAGHVAHHWVIDDADDEERLILIKGRWNIFWARLFCGAQPITTLYRGCATAPDPNQEGLFE